jgi:hypothetical protein
MRFATIFVISISLFACNGGTPRAQEPVPTGVWGGKGIQLTVTESGAGIDYGCDSGTIEGRPESDSHGKFFARGTHAFGRGGPRKQGDPAPKPRQAQYGGVRKGDKLELEVLLPELNRNLGKFTLRLGKRPILERCG